MFLQIEINIPLKTLSHCLFILLDLLFFFRNLESLGFIRFAWGSPPLVPPPLLTHQEEFHTCRHLIFQKVVADWGFFFKTPFPSRLFLVFIHRKKKRVLLLRNRKEEKDEEEDEVLKSRNFL